MTVTYQEREVQVELLAGKHYDSATGRITNEGCIDSDVIARDFVTDNGDGSFFYNDVLHDRVLYIDNAGNVYKLDI